MNRRKWIKSVKNSYKIVFMGVCGIAVSSSVIVANAEKLSTTQIYCNSVKIVHKYYMNYGFEEVLLSYKNMVGGNAASSEEFLQVASRLYEAGDADKAIEVLLKALNIYPDDPELYLKIVGIYEQSGKTDKADEIRRLGYELTGDGRLGKKTDNGGGQGKTREDQNKPEAVITQMLEPDLPAAQEEQPEQINSGNGDSGNQENGGQQKPPEEPEKEPDPTPTPTPELESE